MAFCGFPVCLTRSSRKSPEFHRNFTITMCNHDVDARDLQGIKTYDMFMFDAFPFSSYFTVRLFMYYLVCMCNHVVDARDFQDIFNSVV